MALAQWHEQEERQSETCDDILWCYSSAIALVLLVWCYSSATTLVLLALLLLLFWCYSSVTTLAQALFWCYYSGALLYSI